VNTVCLIGRLTADPDQPRQTQSGKDVLNVRLAVNHLGRDEAVFVDVTCWDTTARNAAKYLHKGSLVAVSGKLAQDEWADKETGEKRSKHYINANQVSFLDRAPAQNQAAGAEAPGGIEPF
jgi:single-strand DNA-binding protein